MEAYLIISFIAVFAIMHNSIFNNKETLFEPVVYEGYVYALGLSGVSAEEVSR